MGKAISYIVILGVIWLIVCAIWPFWNRYMIESDLDAAAIYGTKHSIEDTRKFISERTKERGYDFAPEDFHVEKEENNTVSIGLTYHDKISFLGFILKKLEFTLYVRKKETKAFY